MKNRLNKTKLKAIDFFCGAGGMTFGLSQAGIDVLAGIDNDPSCKETYEINNHGSKFIEADIHELSEEQLAVLPTVKIFFAAFTSAFSSYPQAMHLKPACDSLFSFAV